MTDLPRRRGAYGIPGAREAPDRDAIVLDLTSDAERVTARALSEDVARQLLDGAATAAPNTADLMLILAALREPPAPSELRGQSRAVAAYRARNAVAASRVGMSAGYATYRSDAVAETGLSTRGQRTRRRVPTVPHTARPLGPVFAMAGTAAAVAILGGLPYLLPSRLSITSSAPVTAQTASVTVFASGASRRAGVDRNVNPPTRVAVPPTTAQRAAPSRSRSPQPSLARPQPAPAVSVPRAQLQGAPNAIPSPTGAPDQMVVVAPLDGEFHVAHHALPTTTDLESSPQTSPSSSPSVVENTTAAGADLPVQSTVPAAIAAPSSAEPIPTNPVTASASSAPAPESTDTADPSADELSCVSRHSAHPRSSTPRRKALGEFCPGESKGPR